MYNSCVVEERRFSTDGSLPTLLRSWIRTRIRYHRSASRRRSESVIWASLELSSDCFTADWRHFLVISEEDVGIVETRKSVWSNGASYKIISCVGVF